MQSPQSPQAGSLLLNHKALPIILAHESISGRQQLLANLLSTCTALASSISEELVGSVSVQFQVADRATLRQVPSFADWISNRGHLLHECDVCLSCEYVSSHLVERTLALGFRDAAQSPLGLHLQAYEHHGGTSSVVHIVSQLPAQHLQHLHLCFDDHAMDLKAVLPALTALTGLNSLTLRSIVVEQLVPALKGLTSLSTLQLSTLESVAPLALLPTSLVALHLAVITPETETDGSDDDTTYDRRPAVPEVVQMSYLTQCTSLTGNGLPLPLRSAEDKLPPGLQQLHVDLRSDAATDALMGLTGLTGLTLLEPQVQSRERWQALATSLTNLQHVEINYSETVDSAYTTHGWGGFPVHALRMQVPQPEPEDDGTHHYFLVPAGTVSSLTSLSSSLTELSLAGVRSVSPCVVEATPMRLAGVIKQLTGLERLVLIDLDLEAIIEDDDLSHEDHMNQATLVAAIATLPRLTSLSISLPCDLHQRRQHPVMELMAATSLRELTLPSYLLTDFAVVTLACALTNLRHLDLSDNPVSDAPLPAISVQLPLLTSLHLARTSVTGAGLQHLSKLQQLRVLSVPRNTPHDAIRKALKCEGSVLSVGGDGVVHVHK